MEAMYHGPSIVGLRFEAVRHNLDATTVYREPAVPHWDRSGISMASPLSNRNACELGRRMISADGKTSKRSLAGETWRGELASSCQQHHQYDRCTIAW